MEYVNAQRLEDAVATFDRVLAENPLYGEAYNNRGFARAMSGDMAGAEADLLRAIELDPDSFQAIGNLASLYLNTNRVAEARPLARRLLDSDPSNPDYQRLWNFIQ
jgi:Flp pilus assembly protein TadD